MFSNILDLVPLRKFLTPKELAKLLITTKKIDISPLLLYISRKNKNGALFLKKFKSGLKKLKESGKYGQMLKDVETSLGKPFRKM